MTDQNPLDSMVEETDQTDSRTAKEDESLERSVSADVDPDGEITANAVAGAANRVIAFASIAATLGIAAGIAFASYAGRMSARSAQSNIVSTNPNAVVLAASVKPQTPAPADANTPPADLPSAQTPPDPQPTPASHRKSRKRTAAAPGAFAIEGDDELVGFDTSKGVIQTSAAKFFLVSSITAGDISAKWLDGPSNIHYKCDLNASCTLTRKGAAVLYARLKK
jgi:hypothetical protein